MSFSPKHVVLVTGSSSGGLGHAICKEFQAKGWRVFATARNVDSVKCLEDDGCDVLSLDVTNPESIIAAAKELSVKTGGRLDILVNNAGVCKNGPALTEDPSDTRLLIDTNLLGPILVTQAFVPLIVKSGNGRSGVIINISSIAAVTSIPWSATYSASKAALRSLSSSWRMELQKFGVHVIDVVAGGIQTKMLDGIIGPASGGLDSAFYWNWEEIDVRRRSASRRVGSHSPADVAHDVVAAASKQRPPASLYTGALAWLTKYLPYMPLYWVEAVLGRRFGAALVSYRRP